MNIYHVTFKVKRQENEFLIGIESNGINEDKAIEDAKKLLNKHCNNLQYIMFNKIEFIETIVSRVKKLEKYRRD